MSSSPTSPTSPTSPRVAKPRQSENYLQPYASLAISPSPISYLTENSPFLGGEVQIDVDDQALPPLDETDPLIPSAFDDVPTPAHRVNSSSSPMRKMPTVTSSPDFADRQRVMQFVTEDLESEDNFPRPFVEEEEMEVHDFHAPGAEQGADADVDQPYLQNILSNVEITVVDYAAGEGHFSMQTVAQEDLDDFLVLDRPSWTKVRWINVEGLSWDVVKILAQHYEIHPLAVEDLFHNYRIKADVYDKHLFISAVLLAIAPKSDGNGRRKSVRPREEREPLPGYGATKAWRGQKDFFEDIDQGVSRTNILNRNTSTTFLDARAAARNFEVTIEQVSMLLLRDRTVITFFQKGGDIVTNPLYARIKQPLTLLRSSDDPSFLINCLMDTLVDFMNPVVSFYDSEICRIEVRVLEAPKTLYTKQLHLIQAELNLLKRTVAQTQLLLQALAWRQGPLHQPGSKLNFISRTTRVYLNDVLDNCSTLVEMIDSLDRVSDDLINLIFNTLQFQVNVSMQQLSFVNIVFLPLTFLAGVYGMNFSTMPELNWQYGYLSFWIVSLIIVISLMAWFRSQQFNF